MVTNQHMFINLPNLDDLDDKFKNKKNKEDIAYIGHLRQQIRQELGVAQQTIDKVAGPKLSQSDLNNLTAPLLLPNTWWLLGTQGCHLCDNAEDILRLFCNVVPIRYETIDIIYLNEALMRNFAPLIPVILTPTRQFNYPFSVIELQQRDF